MHIISAEIIFYWIQKTHWQLITKTTLLLSLTRLYFFGFRFDLLSHCLLANRIYDCLVQLISLVSILENVWSLFEIVLIWFYLILLDLFLWSFFMIDEMLIVHTRLDNFMKFFLLDLRLRSDEKCRNDRVHVGIKNIFTLPL